MTLLKAVNFWACLAMASFFLYVFSCLFRPRSLPCIKSRGKQAKPRFSDLALCKFLWTTRKY